MGFAIPINRVARVVDDLLSHGAIRSPWIGVQLRGARSANTREVIAEGAVIGSVSAGSPAATAGLQPGDVILSEGSRTIRNPFDWQAALLDLRVGSPAKLHVKRGTREMDVNVTVADLPEVTAPKVQVLREHSASVTRRSRRSATPQRRGRAVTGSAPWSPIKRAAGGDVIVQINNTRIRNAQDVQQAIDYYGNRTLPPTRGRATRPIVYARFLR